LDAEAGVAGLGGDVEAATVALHDGVVDDVESLAGAAAGRLGGEEGIEDLVANLGRDTGTGVADLDDLGVIAARRNPNRELAGAAHGVDRVRDDVRPDLTELAAV